MATRIDRNELRMARLKKQLTEAGVTFVAEGIEFDPWSDCPLCDDVNHPAYNGPLEVTQEMLDAHEWQEG